MGSSLKRCLFVYNFGDSLICRKDPLACELSREYWAGSPLLYLSTEHLLTFSYSIFNCIICHQNSHLFPELPNALELQKIFAKELMHPVTGILPRLSCVPMLVWKPCSTVTQKMCPVGEHVCSNPHGFTSQSLKDARLLFLGCYCFEQLCSNVSIVLELVGLWLWHLVVRIWYQVEVLGSLRMKIARKGENCRLTNYTVSVFLYENTGIFLLRNFHHL